MEKIAKKTVMRNFFNFFFFNFFSENVLKTLLKESESSKKKYWIILRNILFLIKSRKNRWKKKVVRNFLTNLKFFIFFNFFSENVLKTFLKESESTRKKYWIVFEKYTFFDKKSKKSLRKKSCSKFFDKFKNFYFFRVFVRKCL